MREVQPQSRPPLQLAHKGDLQSFVQGLKEKNQQEQRGERPERSFAIVVEGGGQLGLISGNILYALCERGFTQGVDHMVGVSAGAANIMYANAHDNPKDALMVYEEDIPDKGLISVRNPLTRRSILQTRGLEEVFRRGKRSLDIEKLRESPTSVWIGLTDWDTGTGWFVRANAMADPITALLGSVDIFRISDRKLIHVGGIPCVDGGIANPIPFDFAKDVLHATDILVLLSAPPDTKLGKLAQHFLAFNVPFALREAIFAGDKKRADTIDTILSSDSSTSVIYPVDLSSSGLHVLTNDRAALRRARMDIQSNTLFENILPQEVASNASSENLSMAS